MTKRSMTRLFGTTLVLLFAMGNNASASPRMQPDLSQVQSALVASSAASSTAISIATGVAHSCVALTSSGARCWGYNGNGQLGDGTTTVQTVPVYVYSLTESVSAMAGGGYHTCTLTATGGVKCWGNNNQGQLGDSTFFPSRYPIDVTGLPSGVSAIVAGPLHTCALSTGGGVKCWGDNSSGQLGDGTTINRNVPTDVIGLTSGVSTIAAGWSHTCALTTSGAVKCWGNNSNGQIGDGTSTEAHLPVQVSGLTTGVTGIAGGRYHTCAALASGGAKCWGDNGSGQLGDGTSMQRLVPASVIGLVTNVTAVTAGEQHTCAVVNGGGAKCWGNNLAGQLGDGTTTQRLVPVDVAGMASGVSKVAAGFDHTCALMTSGNVKCWGGNSNGALGDGTRTGRATPVDVIGLGGTLIPDITPILSGTQGNQGWFTSNVTVNWIVNDPESGIVSSNGCGTTTLAIDTAETTVTCSATNGRGLESSRSVTIKIDKTSPTITGSRTPTTPNGWYNGNVTVHFNCTDALSGVRYPLPQGFFQVVTEEGAGQSREGSCTDLAGNLATVTVGGINIDKTPPIVTLLSRSPLPNEYGWNNTNVTLTSTCTDALSGVQFPPPSPIFVGTGAGQSRLITCVDQASNLGTVTVSGINIDKTKPAISLTSPQANVEYNHAQTLNIAWTADDALSAIAMQSATLDGNAVTNGQVIDLFFQTLGSHTVTVNATDKAGNTQSTSTTFTIKADASSLSAAVDRALALGWISKTGTADSLRSKLDAVKDAIARGQVNSAKSQLNAFLNELEAQNGKAINQQAYDLLKADALYLLSTLH